jgi:hypothetical protein
LARSAKTALQWVAVTAAAAVGIEPVLHGGTQFMTFKPRLDALKDRHEALEHRIHDEDHRPQPDADALTRLKIEKLHIKEEIERLKTRLD